MALMARPTSATSTPSLPAGYPQAGARNVASTPYAQISEISPQVGVLPDHNFNLQDFSDWRGKRQPEPEPLHNAGGNFSTPSATFLALMNQEQASVERVKAVNGVKGAFQGLLSKAIRAYEGTAAVINGEAKPRGASYSMSL